MFNKSRSQIAGICMYGDMFLIKYILFRCMLEDHKSENSFIRKLPSYDNIVYLASHFDMNKRIYLISLLSCHFYCLNLNEKFRPNILIMSVAAFFAEDNIDFLYSPSLLDDAGLDIENVEKHMYCCIPELLLSYVVFNLYNYENYKDLLQHHICNIDIPKKQDRQIITTSLLYLASNFSSHTDMSPDTLVSEAHNICNKNKLNILI